MKKIAFNGHFSALLAGSALLLVSGVAQAAVSGGKHDLAAGTMAKFTPTVGTAEICVFCHTPHGASSTAPLWNRSLKAANTYTVYSSSTMDSANSIGGISLACLSCHDGTQAMNAGMLNAPGSDGYNSAGATWAGTWSGPASVTGASNISFIGTDLSNDHPVGIQYGGGKAGGYAAADIAAGTTVDVDYKAIKYVTGSVPSAWYVDTNGNATKQKTDLYLYSKSGAPQVECATCHDPHTATATFLRTVNTNSGVCLACHTK